jgi:hypothetical protein
MKKLSCERCLANKKLYTVKTDKYSLLCDECCRDYLGIVSDILQRHRNNFFEQIKSPYKP